MSDAQEQEKKVTPLRCLVGAVMSAILGTALYFLTSAIAVSFATKPIVSDNQIVLKISSAVRTLVLGVATLGTFTFVFVTVGLILLGLQLLLTRKTAS